MQADVISYPQKLGREVIRQLKMLKLLIADAVEEFCGALAEQVRGIYRIRICHEGQETLETILEYKPDLLVLDMMLPGLDGISILQETDRAGVHPVVLATTKFANDYMVSSAGRLGVGYMMVKPCNVKATASRLQDLSALLRADNMPRPEPRTVVTNILKSLGIPTKLRGYAYLREAVLEMLNRPGQSVTKELYPKVGKLCGATGTQVERSIRSAIEKAWMQRDEVLWRQYGLNGNTEGSVRPTNSEFITQIADRLATEWEKLS